MERSPFFAGFVEGTLMVGFVYGAAVAGILLRVLWAWSRYVINILEVAP